MLSNFAGEEPIESCRRFDRKKQTVIEVNRPASVSIYNRFMGGVDKSDMYLSLYRTKCRTRKWYMRFFTHFINQAVINLVYVNSFGGTKSLLEFMQPLCISLLFGGVSYNDDEVDDFEPHLKRTWSLKSNQFPEDVRYDCHNHWRTQLPDQQRCKFTGCSRKTRFQCSKCNVYLCVVGSLCFTLFHGVRK